MPAADENQINVEIQQNRISNRNGGIDSVGNLAQNTQCWGQRGQWWGEIDFEVGLGWAGHGSKNGLNQNPNIPVLVGLGLFARS